MRALISATLAGLCLLSTSAYPQSAPGASPSPEALQAARDVVTRAQGDRTAVLKAMSAPMIGLIQQAGVNEPDRAQVLVQEVVMPVLSTHLDQLVDMQARIYATALSVDDLKAVAAFYATPAGHDLTAAQPKIAQAQIAGMSQWMGAIAPEMQAKLVQAVKAHGWAATPKAK